jgi:diguanylate cyclase (GGDEF)-like protein
LHTSQRLQDEINEQARHDTLTGAYNRRALAEFADREWVRAVRHGYPFSVLTVDIDHFKIFNDQHGHPIGDATLVQVSASSQAALRADDIWCRYGGEEFVALLPNTSIEQAMVVAERLRSSVEKATITTPNGLLNVSVSIGVAERSSSQSSWADALAASDAALYDAKRAGRNRIAASGSTTTIASTVA